MNEKLVSVKDMFNKCERSINYDVVIRNLKYVGDKYINSELEDKYLISGYEHLSKLIQNIIKSGRGYFIMGYVHEKGINVSVSGMIDLNLLIDYSRWCAKQGEKILLNLQEEILELLEKENQMSIEEIRLKNLEYLYTQKKILENIFDMEKKKPYCEKLRTIKTVEQSLNDFIEINLLIDPLEMELKNLGFIK